MLDSGYILEAEQNYINVNVNVPKTQFINKKTDKLNFIKIKNSCTSKDIIKKIKHKRRLGEHFQEVNYMVCKLYFNKIVKKKKDS